MLARVKSSPASVAFSTQILQQWRHVPQHQPISRMLFSTNQSRIVDVSHDNELRRGLKTSGDKQDYEEKNKPVSQKMKEGVNEMKDQAKDKVNRTADRLDKSADKGSVKMQEMADRSKNNLNIFSDKIDDTADHASNKLDSWSDKAKADINHVENNTNAQDREKTQRINMEAMEDPSDQVKKDMRRVGNANRLGGAPTAAGKRLEGASYGKAENVQESLNKERTDRDVAESYDIAQRRQRESAGMSPQDMQPNRDIPGTNNPRGANLRGTEDNFDNDPAVSIGDMEDKIRETKKKITGQTDNVMENMKKSMMDTNKGIRDTVVGMTEAAKETVHNTAVKTKEFLTGERESEKPDETNSQVRTGDKKYPNNKGPSQSGSSEETTKW